MLARLSIRDIVLIDQLDLEFSNGLTILTGETGAGKSILLDSLSLALGGRGDGGLVRQGQAQGQVAATFDLPPAHRAFQRLAEQDIAADGELIFRRVQMADGRTRAFINDQSVSAQTLRAVAADLVEIHGQHAERALLDASMHRELVDAYGGHQAAVKATRAAHAALREAEAQLGAERARVAAAREAADFARHAHEELTRLDPKPGEEAALAEERARMMQGEKVAADIREAHDNLSGDAAVLPVLSAIARRLQRRMPQAPALIEPSVLALDEAMTALEAATQAVENALAACDFNPRDLERCEERLFALRGMARKYATPVDGLAALAQKYADELADLSAGEERIVSLEAKASAAATAYAAAAAALSKARESAARELERSVNAELPALKLERARFSVDLVRDDRLVTSDGYDRAEFCVQTNPGSRPGPLMKVASGGELARFLLALKVSLAERDTSPTLVFDEIDTGVGGAVADAIGQRMARLAAKAQVLAVTHAPQVAARSHRHLKIMKSEVGKGERVATKVLALDPLARREEIARMLAGAEITVAARLAAESLIEKAG
ncbi:MAG: DNA repair protein RecN [Hyphomicrobiales bacterium]|nr:DNA repair protein RecN [Hyphomicrobiales bacterium]